MSYVTLEGGKAGSSSFKTRPDNLRSDDSFEMLLGLGSGRWQGLSNGLKSLYINNVPLENADNTSNFKDFVVFFADGDPSQEQLVNFKLGGGGGTSAVGTIIANDSASAPGPWVSAAVTTPNADFIDLRFVISALYYQDKKGIRDNSLTLEIEMRPSGTNNWINPTTSNVAPTYSPSGINITGATGLKALVLRSAWNSAGNQWNDPHPGYIKITGKTTSPFVKELRIAVPNTGAYANKTWQVRVRLVEKDLVQDDPIEERRTIQWESIAAVTKQSFGSADEWRGLAWMQVVGKASDQLSGVPDLRGIYKTKIVKTPPSGVYNVDTRQYTGSIWDGSYSLNYTDDPAWCLKDLIEDPISGIAALSPGATLDRWDSLEVSKYCSQLVSDGRGGTHPRFSMNLKVDQAQNAEDLVQYMAGAVNAMAWDSGDGAWRMKQDKPENPVALFTRDNIIGEFTYQHTDVDTRYNDYTVTFLNKENNYTEDRARVYDQANIDSYGRKPTTVVAVGANNRQEALRRAMFRLRVSLNETKIVNFTTNRQGLLLRPLDVILVADTDLGYVGAPTASDNRTTTRLSSRSGTTLSLGSSVRLENGVDYTASFTYPNPDYNPDTPTQPNSADWQKPTLTITRNITNTSAQRGDVDTLYINSALPTSVAENAVVALAATNLPSLPRQYRVLEVSTQDDEFVSISALIIDTGKYAASDNVNEDAILGQIPNPTVPPPVAPPDGMFDVRLYDGEMSLQRVLGVSWLRPGSLFLDGFKVEYNINDGPWVVFKENTKDTYVEIQNPTNGKYTFRITALDRRGRNSLPLVGAIILDETSGSAPSHTFGTFANRPVTAVEGERYTTTDQTPNATYIWSDGGWKIESTINRDASELPYDDDHTLQEIIDGKITIDTTPPAVPTGLVLQGLIVPDSMNQMVTRLVASWNPVGDADLNGYVVAVQEDGSGPWAEYVVGRESTQFIVPAVSGRPYSVKVLAFDFQGNRSNFSTAANHAGITDTVPPAKPTNITFDVAFQSVFFEWDNAPDADLAYVEVYENTTNNSSTAVRVGSVSSAPNGRGSWGKTGLTTGGTYYYWFRSVDLSGNKSDLTTVVTATTIAIAELDFTPTASGIQPVKIVSSLPTTGNFEGRLAMLTTDGKLYRYVSGAWKSTVDASDIQGTINANNFSTSLRPVEVVSTLPTTGNFNGRVATLTTDGKLYRYNAGAWTAAVPAVDVTGQLTNSQIADIAASKLTGQIVSTQIADAAINNAKLAANLAAIESVASLPSTGNFRGRTVMLQSDGKLYRWNSTTTTGTASWVSAVPSTDITGQITSTQITDNAITTAKIAAGAVTANEIAAATITGDKIVAGTISSSLIAANAITANQLAIGDFTNKVVNDWSGGTFDGWATSGPEIRVLTVAELGSVLPGWLSAQNIMGPVLACPDGLDRWVNSPPIPVKEGNKHHLSIWLCRRTTGGVNDSVIYVQSRYTVLNTDGSTSYTYGTNTVSSGTNAFQYVSFVTTAPANAIYLSLWIRTAVGGTSTASINYFTRPVIRQMMMGELIVDGSIIADKIASNAVTTAKIAANAVTANEIAAGTITATEIATNAITTAKINAGAVTATELATNSVTTAKIAAGAVTATEISAGSIIASKLMLADFSNLIINNWTDGTSDGWAASIGPIMFDAKADPNAITAGFPGWGIRQPGDGGWIRSSSSTCSTGEKFYVELYVYRNSALSAAQTLLQVRWNIVETDGSETAAYSSVQGTTTTGSFVKLSGIVTAPAGARLCSIWIRPTTSNISSSAYVSMFRPVLRRASSSELIVDGSITANHLTSNSVTTAKIAAGAVTANELAVNAVTADKIASNAIIAAKIAANAVTADKINVASLSALSAIIGVLRTASSGSRLEIRDNVIKVYEGSTLRVKLGNLDL